MKLYLVNLWGNPYLIRAASPEAAVELIHQRFPGAACLIPPILGRLKELSLEGEPDVIYLWRRADNGRTGEGHG